MSAPFSFRQFTIVQEESAFKVGTDSVLLGSWTDVQDTRSVLDIGTGTGILALMMAQRTGAKIDAVETDPRAAAEAARNFEKSPWNDRLRIIHSDFTAFYPDHHGTYDLLISNPPYFRNALKNPDERLRAARHNDLLPFEKLAEGVGSLMEHSGKFSCILPEEGFAMLEKALEQHGLFAARKCYVRSFSDSPVIRVMGEFSRQKTRINETFMHLYERAGHTRSDLYASLSGDFYL